MEIKRLLGNLAKSFLAMAALSVSAYAGADSQLQTNNTSCVVTTSSSCGTGGGCCCGEPCCEPPACGIAYNPAAYCRCNNPANCCNECSGWAFNVDFLWWRTCATGIALGSEEFYEDFVNSAGASDHYTAINRSHLKKPDFKFDPGFRLGAISYCACECWDIALEWTHYHTTAHAHGRTTDDTVFISYWERGLNNSGLDYPDEVESRYSLNLDLLDLEFGRKYYVSSCFVLRPHFGLRGARINQDNKVFSERFNDSELTTLEPGLDYTTAVKARNDFLAIGPRVGLQAEVHLGCGFSLVGEAAGSLVYGRFDRHAKEYYKDYAQPTSTDLVDEFIYEAKTPSDRCSRAFTDLSFGFKWQRCFDWCGRLHPVGLAFTWEHHAFFNMSNFNFGSRGIDIQTGDFSQSGGSARTGDIYTQGLTVSASIGF